MNKCKSIFFLLLIMSTIVGCRKQPVDVYLFRNDKYFSIFDEKKQVYIDANRFFNKKFYSVKDVNVSRFTDLSREYQSLRMKVKNQSNSCVLFMDNLCLNTFISTENNSNLVPSKIVTYNYDELTASKYNRTNILNFIIDDELVYKTIINQIKLLSKKPDFSDVVYVYGASYSISLKVADRLKKDYPSIQTNSCVGSSSVKTYLKNQRNSFDVFVVFDFDSNAGLIDLDEKDFEQKHIIEVFSNYGETYSFIEKSIVINEPVFVNHVLYSKYLKEYLRNKQKKADQGKENKNDSQNDKEPQKKKKKIVLNQTGVNNVPISYTNCISVLTHKIKGEHLAIRLEEKIKEDNERKEKAKEEAEKKAREKEQELKEKEQQQKKEAQ